MFEREPFFEMKLFFYISEKYCVNHTHENQNIDFQAKLIIMFLDKFFN